MTLELLLIWLLIGAIAGWLAGTVVRGGGFGLPGDIIVGIVGAVIGGWLFGQLGILVAAGILGAILSATVGAIVLLLVIKVLRRA
jgi:uncharacterized membrane protein YeaQ/YmgE (transglycosylase-associated protein family)